MKCRQCGFINQEGSRYCSSCGSKLEAENNRSYKEVFLGENNNYGDKSDYLEEYFLEEEDFNPYKGEEDYSYGPEESIEGAHGGETGGRKSQPNIKPIRINDIKEDEILDRDKERMGRTRGARIIKRTFLILLLLLIAASSFLILKNIGDFRDLKTKVERLRVATKEEVTEERYLKIAEDFMDINLGQEESFKKLLNKISSYSYIDKIDSYIENQTIRNGAYFLIGMGDYSKVLMNRDLINDYHEYLIGNYLYDDLGECVSDIRMYANELGHLALNGNFEDKDYYSELLNNYNLSIKKGKEILKGIIGE